MNWRGKPLVSLETIINLIAGTTNSTGLEVYARLDESAYPDQIKVTNAECKTVNIGGREFHPSGTTSSRHTVTDPPSARVGPSDSLLS
jgi:Rhodopirellula transposase DDE domain